MNVSRFRTAKARDAIMIVIACMACLLPGASAEKARVLRLGHFPNITHAQALYARAGGQFERRIGIPIQWTSFNAGPSAIEALFGNAIDATFVGPNPAINGFLRSQGDKFVIVAGAASGGAALVVLRDAGIQTERDFDGKIIATPQMGNTQDVAARVWFTQHGYRFTESGGNLTLLALSNPDQLTFFKRGEIQGAWTVEPWVSRLELEGGGRIFLEEKTLWPHGRYVTTHLLVSKDFLTSNPKVIKHLIGALVEVTQQINADKPAAAKILNRELQKETGKALPEAVITQAMQRVEFTWDPICASLRQSAEAAYKLGFLRAAPDLRGIYLLNLLNSVLKEKHLPVVTQ